MKVSHINLLEADGLTLLFQYQEIRHRDFDTKVYLMALNAGEL